VQVAIKKRVRGKSPTRDVQAQYEVDKSHSVRQIHRQLDFVGVFIATQI